MSTQTKILSGQSLSGEIDVRGLSVAGVIFPAAWTAADLSFQAADVSGGTFGEILTDPGSGTGTALALDGAAGQVSLFTLPNLFDGISFIKVRSGPSGVPVNQGADRALIILTMPVSK